MQISRDHDEQKLTYSIKFTFTAEELVELDLQQDFNRVWNTRSEAPYVDFVAKFMRRRREHQAQASYGANPFDNLFRTARQRAQSQPPPRQKTTQEKIFEEVFGKAYGTGYTGGFDPGYAGAARSAPPTPEPAWCKVLGLPRTATKDEVKKRYRELAKKHHPDVGGNATKFKEITKAYEEALR